MRALKQAPPAAAVPPGYVPVSALIEAREEVESWAAYASPYFQDKHDLAGVLAKIDAQIAAAQAQQPAAAVPETEAKYAELLYAVESKWPGESRHETALRYIREREAGTVSTNAQSAMLAAAAPAAATQNPKEK